MTTAVVVGGDAGAGARIAAALTAAGTTVVDEVTSSVTVVVHAVPPAAPIELVELVELDDAAWDAAALEPVAATIRTLQTAHAHGGRPLRVLVVVPSEGLVGAPGHVAACTAGEAQRALAKSAARSWGGDGVTVNVLAVPMAAADGGVRGAALPAGDDVAAAALLLLSDAAHRSTGVTLVADAGTTMLP